MKPLVRALVVAVALAIASGAVGLASHDHGPHGASMTSDATATQDASHDHATLSGSEHLGHDHSAD